MEYNNKQAFVPQSFDQLKKEYIETPFWLARFGPGSQITIVEDQPRNKPFRYVMKPSQRGGPSYAVFLIKISDGYVTKDLELSKTNAALLFMGVPDHVQNFKGVTLANDNGRWIFISEESAPIANTPSSTGVPANVMGALDQKDKYVESLCGALKTSASIGHDINTADLIKICGTITTGNALELINYAKDKGFVYQDKEFYKVVEP